MNCSARVHMKIYGLRRLAAFFFFHFQVKWNELTVYFIITKHSRKRKEGDLRGRRPCGPEINDNMMSPVAVFHFSTSFSKNVISFFLFGLQLCVCLQSSREILCHLLTNKHTHVKGKISKKTKEGHAIKNRWSLSTSFFAIENHWLTFIMKR